MSEIPSRNTVVHSFMSRKLDQTEICSEYKRLQDSLASGLFIFRKQIRKNCTIPLNPITVEVDHSDKYLLLNKCSMCYPFGEYGFEFPNILFFFRNLIDFCSRLNEACNTIYRANRSFITLLIKNHYSKDEINRLLTEYKCTELRSISVENRLAILQDLGLQL